MKIAFAFLSLIALLGIAYGLAFFGIIPAQKMADNSPALASALIPMHLAKAKKPAHKIAKTAVAPDPARVAMAAQQKQLTTDRAQLDKDRADFEAQKQQALAPSPDGSAVPAPDPKAKLNAIYAAMSPDDLTPLFGKLSDSDVSSALLAMDEKKAGKVLAALPADRAARLTHRMANPAQTASAAPLNRPQTSL